jgi:gamma-glutamyltranspeptidase/glutathione hydrolase
VPRVSIAAPSLLAARAAASVADAGGNAVDAALAATLVAAVTEPGMIGPGCGGFVTVWPRDDDPIVIDGYAEMPGRGLPPDPDRGFGRRISMAYGGGMETLVGAGSVATPGGFAAFGEASERYGALPWPEVVAPSVVATENGFPLSPVAASYLAYAAEPIFDADPEGREALRGPGGARLSEGETVVIPGLSEALRLVADEGPAAFYTGEIGRRMSDAVLAGGGRLTGRDLAEYRAEVRPPTLVDVDDWKVATNPAPAIGGAVLAAMLLLLDDHPFTAWDAAETRRMAEVQRSVLRYRARHLDEPGDRAGAAEALLAAARVGDLGGLLESGSTVHTSAVDSDGLACAITVSAGYGSGVVVPGTGLWLNNSLGELELQPHGLDGFRPGDRLPSNMAPTIAKRSDGAVLAVGSPGASRITTALAQVLLNFIHLGMSLGDAVDHPRLHVEVFEGRPSIAFEPGLPVEPFGDLAARRFPGPSMYFGGVGAAMWDPRAGHFTATDPRRSGATVVAGAA